LTKTFHTGNIEKKILREYAAGFLFALSRKSGQLSQIVCESKP